MLSVHKTTKHEKQKRGIGTGRQFVLTERTKTIERTGTGRQFPPFLASLQSRTPSPRSSGEESRALG